MKKTLLISELYPPKIGGSCLMMANRAAFFDRDDVCVLTAGPSDLTGADESNPYPIIHEPMPWKGPRGLEWSGVVWAIVLHSWKIIFRKKIRVIECARPLPEGVAGLILSLLTRRKLLVNFHGEDISVLKNYRLERFLLKFLIRCARLNLANSSFTERLIKEVGGPGARTAIVHPGFDPKPFTTVNPDSVEKIRNEFHEGPILLTVGRLQRRKGQDQVIRALPAILKEYPGVRYLAVGSTQGGTGGLADELVRLSGALGVREHFHMVGEVPFSSLPSYIAACDVFLMPNRTEGPGDVEGFGIVFLEAGYLGKPVIGGLSGGVPDAIKHGETGLLVDGNSPEEIAEAVIGLLKDPEKRRTMGNAGRDWALQKTNREVFQDYVRARQSASL